ncbi:unnamed protein product, partial [Ectocarpus sp. 13 AM-2016]
PTPPTHNWLTNTADPITARYIKSIHRCWPFVRTQTQRGGYLFPAHFDRSPTMLIIHPHPPWYATSPLLSRTKTFPPCLFTSALPMAHRSFLNSLVPTFLFMPPSTAIAEILCSFRTRARSCA